MKGVQNGLKLLENVAEFQFFIPCITSDMNEREK